jgi:hypothetical protein
VVLSQATIGVPGARGGAMWNSDRRQSVSRYKIPVGDGVVGLIALIGMGIALMDTPSLRYFVGLAVALGGGTAIALNWLRGWRQG